MGSERRSTETVLNMARISGAKHLTPLTITSSAQQIIIDKDRHAIELQNTGAKSVFYGGVGVTSSNGIEMFPGDKKTFTNVENTFNIYFVTNGADTSELRRVVYK